MPNVRTVQAARYHPCEYSHGPEQDSTQAFNTLSQDVKLLNPSNRCSPRFQTHLWKFNQLSTLDCWDWFRPSLNSIVRISKDCVLIDKPRLTYHEKITYTKTSIGRLTNLKASVKFFNQRTANATSPNTPAPSTKLGISQGLSTNVNHRRPKWD